MQWRERLKEAEGKEKELKEEKEEEYKAQVLNGERERESRLCKSVRNIFSVLQDCCNCVVVYERQIFRLFNFFAMYK